MRTRIAAVVGSAALAMAMTTMGAAQAAPVADISDANYDIVAVNGNVSVSGDTATLSFVYRCTGEAPAVWASVKQLEDPTATADWDFDTHGTSGASEAWYDTHTGVPCTGKAQRTTVQISRADFSGAGGPAWSQLQDGVGYIQLCLTAGEEGAPGSGFAAQYEWARVTVR